MDVSRTRRENFSGHGENCQQNASDLEGSLVTSSRPPGRPQKRPDDRTSNGGVAAQAADGSQRTASVADKQCPRYGRKKLVTIVGHQFVTLTVYFCVQHGEREAPRRAGLSAATVETCIEPWLPEVSIASAEDHSGTFKVKTKMLILGLGLKAIFWPWP